MVTTFGVESVWGHHIFQRLSRKMLGLLFFRGNAGETLTYYYPTITHAKTARITKTPTTNNAGCAALGFVLASF